MKITTKHKMRDLLCLALNDLIKKNLIDLKTTKETHGSHFSEILGKPSKTTWEDIGHGEIRLTVWWGIKPGLIDSSTSLPSNRNKKDALQAACSIWIERKDGIWLQGAGEENIFDTYCSKEVKQELLSIEEVEPNGYRKEGKFYA